MFKMIILNVNACCIPLSMVSYRLIPYAFTETVR